MTRERLRQILISSTEPSAVLARRYGLRIQQVAGYRAAATLKRRQRVRLPKRPTAGHSQEARGALDAATRYLRQALRAVALVGKTLNDLERYLQ